MINDGHGIEIANGVQDMIIGGTDEAKGEAVHIDYTGEGMHGVFINGSNATTPIKNIRLGVYHFGTQTATTGDPVIGGDVIHITGNVEDLDIGTGATVHNNDTGGARGTGYGSTDPR